MFRHTHTGRLIKGRQKIRETYKHRNRYIGKRDRRQTYTHTHTMTYTQTYS